MSPEAKQERRYSVPSDLVEGFQQDLAQIGPDKTFELPSLTEWINHSGKYSRPDITVPEGFLVDPQLDAFATTEGDAIPRCFFYKPPHRLGRENSHNKVFFGEVTNTDPIDQFEVPGIDIAVKTKSASHYRSLLGELAMFQYMSNLELPTFRPYGLLHSNENFYLMTLTERPVDTMDTIDWRSMELDERWTQLHYAIETLGILHGHLLFHGDSEFKNIGFDDTGDIVVVDPELMVSSLELGYAYESETVYDIDEKNFSMRSIKRAMSKDFTDLIRSIHEYIFRGLPDTQRPGSESAVFKELKRHLFNPYRNLIYEGNGPFKSVLLAAYEAMLHERKEMARNN
jgi:hypothetical protein